jgi:hypothetical protein
MKCIFRASDVNLLGYKVSAEGSRPLEERVAYLQDSFPPKTASQLRRVLGMLYFIGDFCSMLLLPPIVWTPNLHRAFKKSKASLSSATLLAHPDPSAPLALVTDASTSAMGAVLQQRVDNA